MCGGRVNQITFLFFSNEKSTSSLRDFDFFHVNPLGVI